VDWRLILVGGTVLTLGILEARFVRATPEWQWRGGLLNWKQPRESMRFLWHTFTLQTQIQGNKVQAAALIVFGSVLVFLGLRYPP
jgi:hypothetical protein